jgi:hypothetical protein
MTTILKILASFFLLFAITILGGGAYANKVSPRAKNNPLHK